MASCSCRGDFAPNRLCMCGCMHERAPKAAVDAYARRGRRHRRALRGYISFQAASTRAYIRRPMPMRVVYMRELAMAMASHMCTCGANPACERASTAAPGVITASMRSAAQSPAAQHSRQQGAPRANSLFWPVYLSNGPSKRVSYTPNAMAIPSREDFSGAPLGTEVGKPTSGHGQAAYNQKKTSALAYLNTRVSSRHIS